MKLAFCPLLGEHAGILVTGFLSEGTCLQGLCLAIKKKDSFCQIRTIDINFSYFAFHMTTKLQRR